MQNFRTLSPQPPLQISGYAPDLGLCRLSVSSVSPAASKGNPVPLRKIHSWTSSTAKMLAQKKPPQIPRPTGRRHSVDSDGDSSDSDDIFPLQNLKKKAGQKR